MAGWGRGRGRGRGGGGRRGGGYWAGGSWADMAGVNVRGSECPPRVRKTQLQTLTGSYLRLCTDVSVATLPNSRR